MENDWFGRTISLVSNSNIRYVGIFHNIDTNTSQITLKNGKNRPPRHPSFCVSLMFYATYEMLYGISFFLSTERAATIPLKRSWGAERTSRCSRGASVESFRVFIVTIYPLFRTSGLSWCFCSAINGFRGPK